MYFHTHKIGVFPRPVKSQGINYTPKNMPRSGAIAKALDSMSSTDLLKSIVKCCGQTWKSI